MTQAANAVAYIRRHHETSGNWPTYGDLVWFGRAGTCPWQRLRESGHQHLKPGEKLVRDKGPDGLVTFRIVRER